MTLPDRRWFLKSTGVATAGLLSGGRARAGVPDPVAQPDDIHVFLENEAQGLPLARAKGVEVVVTGGKVLLTAPVVSVTKIRLRWRGAFPAGSRFLGDHWERSYGDLEWRAMVGERLMPWYFLASGGGLTRGYGVATGAAAVCSWQADDGGTTLWLDVGNGGGGVTLGQRQLHAATIVVHQGEPGEAAASVARAFCRKMCSAPRLPAQPLAGSNNWYYAYGRNTSAAASLRDADLMAELSGHRPFVVIDMGWGAARDGAGPVSQTQPGFPDMPKLAAEMKARGVRPGIWTRPTLTSGKQAEAWRCPPAGGRSKGELITLDPSFPEALDYIGQNIRTLRDWGFELIKHDFSTFDLTGRWGFEMGPDLTDAGWHFHDRSKTTAEIVLDLYRTIRQSAGDAVLIGCNTIGHLAAGFVEAQRIGDDTSGREWSRTRKMGVNTLAFRMAQHNTFFAADADCVPVTDAIPWKLTAQWLDLVARSGTALFISVDPAAIRADQKPALKAAFAAAARVQQPGVAMDWMETTIPEDWQLEGKRTRYDWYAEGE